MPQNSVPRTAITNYHTCSVLQSRSIFSHSSGRGSVKPRGNEIIFYFICLCMCKHACTHTCLHVFVGVRGQCWVFYSIALFFPGFFQLPGSSRCPQACGHVTPSSASVVTCLIVPPGKPISFCLYEDSCHQIQSLLGESRTMSPLTLSCLQVLEYLISKVAFSGFEIVFHENFDFDGRLYSPSPVAVS